MMHTSSTFGKPLKHLTKRTSRSSCGLSGVARACQTTHLDSQTNSKSVEWTEEEIRIRCCQWRTHASSSWTFLDTQSSRQLETRCGLLMCDQLTCRILGRFDMLYKTAGRWMVTTHTPQAVQTGALASAASASLRGITWECSCELLVGDRNMGFDLDSPAPAPAPQPVYDNEQQLWAVVSCWDLPTSVISHDRGYNSDILHKFCSFVWSTC